MALKHYLNLLLGRSKAVKPAKLTWSNIKGVLQAWRRQTQRMAGFDLQPHIYEQIIWRRFEVMKTSPKCWSNGACVMCGCDILGKTMEDRACEGVCYPEMMKAEEWEDYKRINHIKLFS
jgi:hypothetical protein